MSTYSTPTAAILVIGNEILSGRTRDSNTGTAARKLAAQGIILREVRVVPDEEAAIIEAVCALRTRVSYLFTTGGIGPTHDDITAASIAKAMGVPLEEHPGALAILEAHYGDPTALTPARRKMTLIPKGGRLIGNALTGAPGFAVDNVFVLAGVPAIMEAMLDAALEDLPKGQPVLCVSVTTDKPESMIAQGLTEAQAAHSDVDIGSYPHFDPQTRRSDGVEIVIKGQDAKAIEAARITVKAALKQI